MLKTLLEAALDIIYPPRQVCPICAGHSPGSAVCAVCRKRLEAYAGEIICPVCGTFGGAAGGIISGDLGDNAGGTTGVSAGDSLAGANGGYPGSNPGKRRQAFIICPHCRRGGRAFDLARSVGPYEGPVREAVHRFKYRGIKGLARPLGALMADAARCDPLFSQTQALVPVPLSPGRERKRGFNQSLLLAREIERHLKVPVLEGAVLKIRETPPQAELSRQERLVNLGDSFIVPDPVLLKGKKVTIIDDVFTTGSTVSSISHLMRQADAAAVTVLTFAGTRFNAKS